VLYNSALARRLCQIAGPQWIAADLALVEGNAELADCCDEKGVSAPLYEISSRQ
jgi:hypothetical protein